MVNILIKKIEESLTETEDIELLKKICEPYPFELDNFQKQILMILMPYSQRQQTIGFLE